MKKVMISLMCLSVLLLSGSISFATDSGDSFTVTLTPAGDRGVIIDTTTIALGSLTLGTTQQTANGVPVTSTGTIAPIEYTLTGALSGGWSLSSDGNANAQDELAVFALFTTEAASQPSSATFVSEATTNLVVTSAQQVGDTAAKYEVTDMDSLQLNATKNLWLKFCLPPTTSTGAQQTVTLTVTAEAAN